MNGIYGLVTRLPAFIVEGFSPQRLCGSLLLVASITAWGDPASSESNLSELSQLQADYFVNALRFVRWTEPPMPDEPIDVVLIGGDAVCRQLYNRLAGLSIHGRPVRVFKIDKPGDTESLPLPTVVAEADTIYFGDNSHRALKSIIPNLEQRVLTVSSIRGFIGQGGMVQITPQEDQQLVFRINRILLKSPALNLDSQMLKLSSIVDAESH